MRTDLAEADIPAALGDPRGLLWVDIGCEKTEACEPLLHQAFGLMLAALVVLPVGMYLWMRRRAWA
jgi:hypothetical protein